MEAFWPAQPALPPNGQARHRQGIAGIFTATRHRECIFGRHKGYARLALQAGCPVVPVYHLGNSQVRAGPVSKPGRVRQLYSRMSIWSSACADARSVRKRAALAPAAFMSLPLRRIGLMWNVQGCSQTCCSTCHTERPLRTAQVLSFLPLSLSLSRKIRTACGLFFGRYGLPLPHPTQIVSVVGAPIPGARRARPCAARRRGPGRLHECGCLGASCHLRESAQP